MVGLANTLGKLNVHCGSACKDPETRELWGCDHEAKPGGYTLPCWICHGEDEDCPLCEGKGRVAITRCPTYMVTPEVTAMLRAWRWLDRGFLPNDGAILDQTACFLEACELLDAQEAFYERMARGKAARA